MDTKLREAAKSTVELDIFLTYYDFWFKDLIICILVNDFYINENLACSPKSKEKD